MPKKTETQVQPEIVRDLKEFQSFLKICRKLGVESVTFGTISVTFGPLPPKEKETDDEMDTSELSAADLSPEELAFWHVSGGAT